MAPVLAVLVVAFLLDRLLLWCEGRGWINYRRKGLSRGGAVYHLLELQSIFHPGTQQVIEAKYQERKNHDESGGPPPEAERESDNDRGESQA